MAMVLDAVNVIFWGVLTFSILIVLHEGGHFAAARAFGVRVHEFMVGPAADVAADKPGTPEIADLGMMQAGSVMYTFDGPGPYAFACHAPGHYEAGMTGTITVVP